MDNIIKGCLSKLNIRLNEANDSLDNLKDYEADREEKLSNEIECLENAIEALEGID